MVLEYNEINNEYLTNFNTKNKELISALNEEVEIALIDYYEEPYQALLSVQKEVDDLIMGWFTSPKELENKALNILEYTSELYGEQRQYVRDYHRTLVKSKSYIAVELYDLAIGPLKDVIGYFGKSNIQEFKEIEECCKLDHYNFDINYKDMKDSFKGIDPFDFTQLANNTKIILQDVLKEQNFEKLNRYNSIKDENSFEKQQLKKDLQVEAAKAGIALIGAAFDV